jgi:hypothetical protein
MANGTDQNVQLPVVIDLGRTRKRNIRKLKRGRGKLYEETNDVIEEVREGLGPEAASKEILPVIVVYRQKRKKKNRNGLFPFLF